jgi:hypothetical protein
VRRCRVKTSRSDLGAQQLKALAVHENRRHYTTPSEPRSDRRHATRAARGRGCHCLCRRASCCCGRGGVPRGHRLPSRVRQQGHVRQLVLPCGPERCRATQRDRVRACKTRFDEWRAAAAATGLCRLQLMHARQGRRGGRRAPLDCQSKGTVTHCTAQRPRRRRSGMQWGQPATGCRRTHAATAAARRTGALQPPLLGALWRRPAAQVA